MPRTRHLLIIGSLIFLSTLSALLLVEITLRFLEFQKYKQNPDFEYYKKIYRNQRNKNFLWDHTPNSTVKIESQSANFTFITNADGLRENDDYNFLDQSAIFLGDSVVEGSPVENDETIDSIFEAKTNLKSLNFGLGSASTQEEYFYLLDKYKNDFNTKIILLGFTLNDFDQNTFQRYFDGNVGNWRRNDENEKNLLKKSKALSLIHSMIFKSETKKNLPPLYTDINANEKNLTKDYIEKIRLFADSIGAKFLVIVFPTRSQIISDIAEEQMSQKALFEILKEKNISYIDLFDVIKNQSKANPEINLYHDDVHFTKDGYRLIGETLADKIQTIFPEIFTK